MSIDFYVQSTYTEGMPIEYQPGHRYRTRSGQTALITSIGTGPQGKLYGRTPDYASTWWNADGTHNVYPSDDLIAEIPDNRDKRKYPLRKVVEQFRNKHGAWMERLECGHEVHEREDIYGPTNAYRRRCSKCGEMTKETPCQP